MSVVNQLYQLFANTIPRGPKTEYNFECSCSNSCEKVLELLFENDDKLFFEELQLGFNIPVCENKHSKEKKDFYKGIRTICNSIITNRDLFLSTRILLLGKVLQSIQKAISDNKPINYDTISIDLLISEMDIKKDINYSYSIQEKIVTFFTERSISIESYAKQALNYFKQGNEIEQYKKAKIHLYNTFPNMEIMMEKAIHNYLFYEQFPFSNQLETFWDEFESLCGVYLFIKYLVIGYMADKNSLNDLVDVLSAAFRLINHTSFNRNVDIIMINENINSLQQLAILITS